MSEHIEATLLVILHDDEILLAFKKRGTGVGKFNGPGGKVEAGESPLEAVIRESHEELSITPIKPSLAADFTFEYANGTTIHTTVFICHDFEGTPTESEEMRPEWFKQSEIPYGDMWQDDVYWLPAILHGQRLTGRFSFNTAEQCTNVEIQPYNEPITNYA